MNYRLTELPLLLTCSFDEARAWVRALEQLEPVERDAKGARTVTPSQLERIAVARLVAANRQMSRGNALDFVAQLNLTRDAIAYLESSRTSLGIMALEARVASIEALLGVR